MRTEREEYLERVTFEHELINRRLTWLITSQAILFAAYAVSLEKGTPSAANAPSPLLQGAALFRQVTAWSGIAIAVLILLGVTFTLLAKRKLWKIYRTKHPSEPFGVITCVTYAAFASDALLALVFVVAWVVVLCNN